MFTIHQNKTTVYIRRGQLNNIGLSERFIIGQEIEKIYIEFVNTCNDCSDYNQPDCNQRDRIICYTVNFAWFSDLIDAFDINR